MHVYFKLILSGLRSSGDLYCYDIPAYYSALVSHGSAWPPLCPTLVASLPRITMVSSQFKQEYRDSSYMPVSVASDKRPKSPTLPWSVTCENFSLYTLHPSQPSATAGNVLASNLLYLIEPVSTDIVIAQSSGVGRTSDLAPGSYVMRSTGELTVCCHISVPSVSLAISRKQVNIDRCHVEYVDHG